MILGGPQSRYGRYGYDKNLLPMPGIELRFIGFPALCSTLSKGKTDETLQRLDETVQKSPRESFCLFCKQPGITCADQQAVLMTDLKVSP
jgi:hypothetical protein